MAPDPLLDYAADLPRAVARAVLTAASVALIEETWFRGALHGAVERAAGRLAAVFGVAVLYALVHFVRPDNAVPASELGPLAGFDALAGSFDRLSRAGIEDSLFALLGAGVLLGVLRARTGRVAECIGMHAGWVLLIQVTSKSSDLVPEVAVAVPRGNLRRGHRLACRGAVLPRCRVRRGRSPRAPPGTLAAAVGVVVGTTRGLRPGAGELGADPRLLLGVGDLGVARELRATLGVVGLLLEPRAIGGLGARSLVLEPLGRLVEELESELPLELGLQRDPLLGLHRGPLGALLRLLGRLDPLVGLLELALEVVELGPQGPLPIRFVAARLGGGAHRGRREGALGLLAVAACGVELCRCGAPLRLEARPLLGEPVLVIVLAPAPRIGELARQPLGLLPRALPGGLRGIEVVPGLLLGGDRGGELGLEPLARQCTSPE